MLYPQILSAHAKDLVHVIPAMHIIPNTNPSVYPEIKNYSLGLR